MFASFFYQLDEIIGALQNRSMDSFENKKSTMVYCVGDSMLNNAIYVEANQSVLFHLRNESQYKFVMLARDNARISDAFHQIDRIPEKEQEKEEASEMVIVLSVGGNDLLAEDGDPRETFQHWLELVKSIRIRFGRSVRILVLGLYFPKSKQRFFDRIRQWNAWLLQNVDTSGAYNVIETSNVITETKDICYKIEPSEQGGAKIADLIKSNLAYDV